MTLSEHIQASGKKPESAQKQWRRKYEKGFITRPFSRDLEPTTDELAILFGQIKTPIKPDKKPVQVSAPVRTDIQTPKKTEKRTPGQRAALVGTMLVCASVSLSNMYDISSQIKPGFVDAVLITGLFSLAPFAMLYAGVSGWAGWLTSGICIAYEVFCNASGIYRGLAGLGNGAPYEVWTAGGFIDTVSRVTTLDFKVCALGVSFGMAGIVAALFLISLIELKK